MPVVITFYQNHHLQDLSYDLGTQQQHTASVNTALERICTGKLPKAQPVTILRDELPAGFFVLDFGEDRVEFSTNENCVLLRSLSVNPLLQGQGIGKEALGQLPEFLRKFFPGTNEIVLAVNENNPRAKKLYEDFGYQLLPRTRIGTRGVQFLMKKSLS